MEKSTPSTVWNQVDEKSQVIEESIAERRLWLAIVAQAVEDWRGGTLRARREAQTFLFDRSADFERVCANAGLDASHLRSKLLKIGRKVDVSGPVTHQCIAA